jgi:hypothetical protein
MVGLDTTHSVEFTSRMQAKNYAEDQKVEGMKVVNCLRFPSVFRSEPEQDEWQKQMEEMGVKVTRNLSDVLEGTDAIMMEIEDPALHLEYFRKVADAGKPVFLDKPPADTLKDAVAIADIAKKKNVKIFSASSLRFAPQVLEAKKEAPVPRTVMAMGPVAQEIPNGSPIVWYGVHTVETYQAIIGIGAKKVLAKKDTLGYTAIIEYSDSRRGIVQLNENDWRWAFQVQTKELLKFYSIDATYLYTDLLKKTREFFEGGEAPVALEDTLEIQAILNAIDESVRIGKEQILP